MQPRTSTQRYKLVYRVNPKLMNIIEELGGTGISKCFDCGTCSVSCPISEELKLTPFPRKVIKYAKLGLEDKLKSSLEPWLCYYCGECSDTCPKEAEPAEIMAAVRRYLIMSYDFIGISRIMYLSRYGWLAAIIVVAGLTFIIGWLLKGPIVLERTELETFAPVHIVDTAGIIVFIVLASILSINIYRMYRFTVGSLGTVSPVRALIELVKTLPVHFFTQIKIRKCTHYGNYYWLIHLMILYGYGLSFLLFVPLLRLTLTNEPFLFVHPLSILGIISTILLLVGTSLVIKGRLEKKIHIWKYSHHTDWMFVILLFLVTLTGILTGIFRTLDQPLLTYAFFAAHIVITAPFLILEVPFAKWSHLAYRPFAIYFMRLNTIKGGGSA